jgi:NADH dehydrogenase
MSSDSVRIPSPAAVVVTGANGYIGREVVRAARAAGLEVRALARHPHASPDPGIRCFPYSLDGEPSEEALEGASAVIHLAMDLIDTGDGGNVQGALKLRTAARRMGVRRFVFVSSQSAAPTAISAYGRSKWQVERALDDQEDIVVRPGMVHGGPERGLFGVLCRMVSKLPVIPVVRGSAPLHPIHVEDLASALVGLATAPAPAEGPLCLGAIEPIPLREFLERLGEARIGRKPWLLPVPATPLVALLAPLSRVLPKADFLRERLLGILALPAMDTAAGWRAAGFAPRPLDLRHDGKSRERRPLLREGIALMRYVFGADASPFAARRWLRLLPPDAEPLRLPAPFTCRPGTLRLIEPLPLPRRGADAAEFTKRLHLALLVGEVSGRGSEILTRPRRGGWPAALLDITLASGWDAVSMPFRLLAHLAWWRR